MIKLLLRGFLFLLVILPAAIQAQQPSSISGLQLWLDASDVAASGTNASNGATVSTWKDKSGQHHDAVTLTGQASGTLVTNSINGQPVVHFTRTTLYKGTVYQVPGVDIRATTNPAVTIFTVYKQGVRSGDQGLWGDDNGAWDRFYFSSWSGNPGPDNGGASLGPTNVAAIVYGAGIQGLTRLLTAVYDHGVTNGSAIYFNGQVVTNFTDQTDPVAAQSSFYLGFDGDDNCYNGDVAEVMVYNRKLTSCELLQVNRYLNAKYGAVFSSVPISASGATTFTEGKSVTLTTSATGSSYQWLRNGQAVKGATKNAYQAAISGDYKIVVGNGGCQDTSAAVTVTATPVPMTAPGNALSLDGTDDLINADTILPASYTKEAWVYITNSNTVNPILSGNASGATSHAFGAPPAAGSPVLSAGHNGQWAQVKDTVALNTGRWYHVAVTYDAPTTTMRLYKNGALIAENKSVAPFTGSNMVLPGGFVDNGANKVLNGRLDEVRLYAGALSQTAIQADMYGAAPQTANLLAYYNFDEGVAGANNAGITTLIDRSSWQHYATLQNFALNGASSNWVESYAMVVPVTAAATGIQINQFTANWTASAIGTATSYVLDVSDNAGFTTLVPGYNALTVTGLSQAITGLKPLTTYYYRVRADKTSVAGQGAYSVSGTATTLAPPTSLSVTTPILCNGGQTGALTASFAGGSADYTMKWYKDAVVFTTNIATTPGATTTSIASKLGAGAYKVEVLDKANKVMGSATAQLDEPALLSATNSITNASCNNKCDGQITLTATGGTTPYTYQLGNSAPTGLETFKNICAGTYAATVTDKNGCTATIPQIVIVNPAPAALSLASHTDTLLCKGATLTVSAAVAQATTYTWTGVNGFTSANSTISVTAPGLYKVIAVQTGGCTYRDSINLQNTAQTAIPARMVVTAHAFVNEEVVAVNLTDPAPQTQVWSIPAGAQVISQAPEKLVMKFATKGQYAVKLGATSYDVCNTRDSATVLVDPLADSVNSDKQVLLREVSVAPNPTTGPFNLIVKLNHSGKVAVRIYSFTGMLVYSTILPDNGLTSITAPIDLSGNNKGTYVVVVETANSSEVRKLLLN